MNPKTFTALVFLIILISCSPKTFRRDLFLAQTNNADSIATIKMIEAVVDSLKTYCPIDFDSLGGKGYRALLDEVAKEIPQRVSSNVDFVFHARRFFDQVTHEDPHFRIFPGRDSNNGYKFKSSNVPVPPFSGLLIGDTLVVNQSYCKTIRKGDRIVSINHIPVGEYARYSYRDRYTDMRMFVWLYHFNFHTHYKMELERNGTVLNTVEKGITWANYGVEQGKFIDYRLMHEDRCGYFKIREFTNNPYILKHFKRFVEQMKQAGYQRLVIDLRENPGGSGYMLDEFFAVFSDKDTLLYLNDAMALASPKTADYGFKPYQHGQLLSLSPNEVVKAIPLKRSSQSFSLNTYVLISRSTGSTAASFANICQYNGIATLVGEPLAHNALGYGEVEVGRIAGNPYTYSLVRYNENTKANNGIVQPDVSIPYVAKDYMQGGDALLEKALAYICNSSLGCGK
jgi:C-terminal processing protease CtpA/Prc